MIKKGDTITVNVGQDQRIFICDDIVKEGDITYYVVGNTRYHELMVEGHQEAKPKKVKKIEKENVDT